MFCQLRTRGQVVNDYQVHIEEEWLKELKSKYTVTINRNVLKDLKSKIEIKN